MNNDTTISHLETLRDEYFRKYKSIDETINLLKESVTGTLTVTTKKIEQRKDGYDTSWVMKVKLGHILKSQGKFLHIRQIGTLLHEYEPGISEKDFIAKLYPAIAELKRTNSIVKVKVGETNLNTFWGSKNWIDNNGEIKPGFKYDENQVKSVKSEPIDI